MAATRCATRQYASSLNVSFTRLETASRSIPRVASSSLSLGCGPARTPWAIRRSLRALGLPGLDLPSEVDEATAMFGSVVTDRRMLLVLHSGTTCAASRALRSSQPVLIRALASPPRRRSRVTGGRSRAPPARAAERRRGPGGNRDEPHREAGHSRWLACQTTVPTRSSCSSKRGDRLSRRYVRRSAASSTANSDARWWGTAHSSPAWARRAGYHRVWNGEPGPWQAAALG